MVNLTKFYLLITTASALAIRPRDVNDVLPNLKTIDTNTRNFRGAILAYTGGSSDPVQREYFQKLDDSIVSAANDAAFQQSYTADQAAAICEYANKTLTQDTQSMLNTLVARRGPFISNGFQGTVQNWLSALQDHTNALFSGGIIRNSPGGVQAACSAAVGRINQAYGLAQRAYA